MHGCTDPSCKEHHHLPKYADIPQDEASRACAAVTSSGWGKYPAPINPQSDLFDSLIREAVPAIHVLVSDSPDFTEFMAADLTKVFAYYIYRAPTPDQPLQEDLRSGKAPSAPPRRGQLSALLWQAFWISNAVAGRVRKFRCAPELAQILMHTDVKIPADDLQLPFRFMAVKLPPAMFFLDEAAAGSAPKACEYLCITKQQLVAATSPSLSSLPVSDLDENGEVTTLNIMVMSCIDPSDPLHGVVLVDSMPLRAGKTVAEELDTYQAIKAGRQRGWANNVSLSLEDGSGRRRDPMLVLFNLAANLALYCTNRSADVLPSNAATLDRLTDRVKRLSPGKKRQKAQAELTEARRKTVLVIGGSFKARDQQVLQSFRLPHSVSVRHMVRGHWKQQVYGLGRQERKHIFVEPYWRGPELAEVLQRDYKLVAPQQVTTANKEQT